MCALNIVKLNLRQELRKRLAELTREQRDAWDTAILGHIQKEIVIPPNKTIALYSPLPWEVNIMRLVPSWITQGHTLCLPVVTGRTEPMQFQRYFPGDQLNKGMVGSLEPAPGQDIVTPEYLFIPMLGFGPQNMRLGLSSGFYDRTLAHMPEAKTIGIAYDMQLCPEMLPEPHDILMQRIVTEKGVRQK